MDNFKIIYKILKHLEASMDAESTDIAPISPERLGISHERWERLLILLQDDGYIKGIVTAQALGEDRPHITEPIHPFITLRGLEYLADNSFMRRAAQLLKGTVEIIK